jgi:uncharacterized membrane protein YsdA (DUF1294 family)
MRKLRGIEMAFCYGSAGFIGGAMAVRLQAQHPNWSLVMGGGIGLITLIVLIAIMRLGD